MLAPVDHRRAVELDPRFSDAYNDLGAAYLSRQQWDAAIDAFRKALALALLADELDLVALRLVVDEGPVHVGLVRHLLRRLHHPVQRIQRQAEIKQKHWRTHAEEIYEPRVVPVATPHRDHCDDRAYEENRIQQPEFHAKKFKKEPQ